MRIEMYCHECQQFFELDSDDLELSDEFVCPNCDAVIDLQSE